MLYPIAQALLYVAVFLSALWLFRLLLARAIGRLQRYVQTARKEALEAYKEGIEEEWTTSKNTPPDV